MANKNFSERYKELYKEISDSVEFKKRSYARRITAIWILILWLLFMPLAFLAERLLNIPDYITYGIAFLLAMTISVLIGEDKAQKKFNKTKGEK